MKTAALLLVVVLAVSISLSVIYAYEIFVASSSESSDEFYFGVTCGFNTTHESKQLIDKVKSYTNLFVIDSWDVAQNETMLNEICDYAANEGMRFIVYFDLISGTSPPLPATYPWHMEWLTNASTRWYDKFLGIYLHDELGGKQVDGKNFFDNASDYSDAANRFVANITSYGSTQFAEINDIRMFTADYALYWWDYLGGYDTVFAELGWNHSTPQQIALARGAANMQGRDWGAIIAWKYHEPPYLGNGTEIYSDMLSAYTAGAKYVLVFDDKRYPETNPYGSLTEEHFDAMKTFSDYVKTHPRDKYGETKGSVALVLPADYGWGARRPDEGLWGIWSPDDKTPLIWQNMNKLSDKYGLSLDIVFDDARFSVTGKYSTVYFWNATIT
jgi:hypothetical protein